MILRRGASPCSQRAHLHPATDPLHPGRCQEILRSFRMDPTVRLGSNFRDDPDQMDHGITAPARLLKASPIRDRAPHGLNPIDPLPRSPPQDPDSNALRVQPDDDSPTHKSTTTCHKHPHETTVQQNLRHRTLPIPPSGSLSRPASNTLSGINRCGYQQEMQDRSDGKLLGQYVDTLDEGAFGELVRRHVDLVYSAARRLVVDVHLAEDATQAVFVALAKDAAIVAARLHRGAPLSAWLHLTTRNVAANLVRTETRRRHREQAALAMQTPATPDDDALWNRIEPHLDPALAELAEPDRDAVLLRFFERKTAREIGQRLGISEEAAQKRVHRALDRLRSIFVSRGLAVPSASLAGVLTVHAVQAAPAALASSATAIAVAGVAAGTAAGTGTGILTIMASTQLKTGIAVLLVAGAITIGLLQQREIHRLRTQSPEPVEASPTNPAASSVNAPRAQDPAATEELLRLRGEVARLRRELSESRTVPNPTRLPASTGSTAAANASPKEIDDAFQAMRLARMTYTKNLSLAVLTYAGAHGDRYPASLEDASAEIEELTSGSPLEPSQFEVLFTGSMAQLSNPAQAIILRERTMHPRHDGQPGFTRCYGFGDGHSEIRTSPDGNFVAWEQEHQPVLKPAPAGGASQ